MAGDPIDREGLRSGALFGAPSAKDARFQTGRSGNPHGRPRQQQRATPFLVDLPWSTAILAEMAREITEREGDGLVAMSRFAAPIKSPINSALESNSVAQRTGLEYRMAAEFRQTIEHDADRDVRRDYCERVRGEIERARRHRARGTPRRHVAGRSLRQRLRRKAADKAASWPTTSAK